MSRLAKVAAQTATAPRIPVSNQPYAQDSGRAGRAGVRTLLRPSRVWLSDGVLALLMVGIALASVVRLGDRADAAAAALACLGASCLAWRRIAPLLVLIVSGGSFCLYQALGYPHAALPFAM